VSPYPSPRHFRGFRLRSATFSRWVAPQHGEMVDFQGRNGTFCVEGRYSGFNGAPQEKNQDTTSTYKICILLHRSPPPFVVVGSLLLFLFRRGCAFSPVICASKKWLSRSLWDFLGVFSRLFSTRHSKLLHCSNLKKIDTFSSKCLVFFCGNSANLPYFSNLLFFVPMSILFRMFLNY